MDNKLKLCYILTMIELLAPAGNIESLDAAIGEGADAVYLGLKSFNARMRTYNFAWNQFEAAVQSLHRKGKKIYVTVNTVIEEGETERLYRFLSYLEKVGPDGLIVQDLGIIRMVQEFFPKLVLHASTQMNVESAAAANLLSKEGFKRVVLARELGLEEIKQIKTKSNVELEIFVHGSLCVSESGLCMFSSFLGGKSANRGMCTQACRRFYTAETSSGSQQGYYFSPSDLQLIDQIPDLIEAGVISFKIEGRMKSAEYVGTVVAAYRYLIDHYKEDKKGSIAAAKRMLATDFARSKTSYWYGFKQISEGVEKAGEAILNPNQAGGTGIYLGTIKTTAPASPALLQAVAEKAGENAPEEKTNICMALLSGGNYDPDPGDSIRLHKKDDTGRVSHKVRSVEIDDKGQRWIDIPALFKTGDSVYLLQTKSMSKRYPRVLPGDISKFRLQPRDEKLPILDLTPVEKTGISYFPEGLYVQVSSISDVFLVQSAHPIRIIIELNTETRSDLISSKTVLPYSKKQLIISLDPFLPAGIEQEFSMVIEKLVAKGYKTFIVNNIAHIALLRSLNANMIAGPYLYTFNRWAASWLENQNILTFITPLENSQKNLESTFDFSIRQRLLITLYAYPALFRIRFKLPETYNFTYFTDKEGMEFKLLSTPDGSFVMAEKPFSILDKANTLGHLGFKRILLDFSKSKVSRNEFRAVNTALIKSTTLPETYRFNWKDGFYSPEKMQNYMEAQNRRNEAELNQDNFRNRKRKSFQNDRKSYKKTNRKK